MATIGTAKRQPLSPSKFDDAYAQTRQFLEQAIPDAVEISDLELLTYSKIGHQFLGGWEFAVGFSGDPIRVRVLVDHNFPFSAARVGLTEPHSYQFAHLESGSLLCLKPNQIVAWDRPADAVSNILAQAKEVIERGLSKDSAEEETRHEIIAYWDKLETGKIAKSLVHPGGKARLVFQINEELQLTFSDSRADAKAYRAASGKKLKPTSFGKKVPLLWLRRPPSFKQLPNSVGELIRLVTDEASGGIEILEKYIATNTGRGTLLLGFANEDGFALIGADFPKIGFEHTRPKKLAFIRPQDRSKAITRLRIRRYDPSWIFGRDQNQQTTPLQASNVAVIGAGSLGSNVAQQLASAGVGRLEIIDPERLVIENTSRHVLGAESVGGPKASLLADRLQRSFRTSEFVGVDSSWQTWANQTTFKLDEFDLVISTIGDWPNEVHLTDLTQQNENNPTMLFAWLEPHALASQAVVLPTKSPCFCCGFSSVGEPRKQVSVWTNAPARREIPLCGGQFQPYGAIALSAHAAHIAEIAVSALLEGFDGPTHSLQSYSDPTPHDGDWSDWWKSQAGDNSPAHRRLTLPWPRDETCKMCGATR